MPLPTRIPGGSTVTGPGSSTDNAIARFNGTGGNVIQDSLVLISDGGKTTFPDSASIAPLSLAERSAAPSSPVSGDVYLDDGTNTASGNPGWRRYTGAAWEDVAAAAGGGSPGGANTQVQFNDSGSFGGDAGLTYNKTNDLLTLTRLAIGVTQGDYGLALVNTTAAAAGAQQYGPPLRFRGYGWKTDATAASQSVDFRIFPRPIQGAAAPTGGLDFQASINGGAYSDLLTVLSGGNVGIGTIDPNQNLTVLRTTTSATLLVESTAGVSHLYPGLTLYDYDGGAGHPVSAFGVARGTKASPTIVAADSNVGLFDFSAHDGNGFNKIARFGAKTDTNFAIGRYDGVLFFATGDATTPVYSTPWRMVIRSSGFVGIATLTPGQIFDVNSGSGNMIADGYDTHASIHAYKENAIAITGAGMINRLKSFKLFEFTRKPHVSADELRTATIKRFSQARWIKAFGGEIVEDEDGAKTIQGDDYRGGKLRTCPDAKMLAFIDSHAEALRAERRPLPEWTRKHLGPILDDPGTKEALGDVIHYDETGETTGYSLNDYIGFLHGVALETITRLEALEAQT